MIDEYEEDEQDEQDRRNLERAIRRCERAWAKLYAEDKAAAKRKQPERELQDEQPDRH